MAFSTSPTAAVRFIRCRLASFSSNPSATGSLKAFLAWLILAICRPPPSPPKITLATATGPSCLLIACQNSSVPTS